MAAPAFVELDWNRVDVTAIVAFGGLITIDERRHQACRDWLTHQSYKIDTFDCRPGLSAAVTQLGRMLFWEQQFGYSLGPNNRNLNAIRDGFAFDISENTGRVFEILRADLAWHEEPNWFCGLLSIVQEESRRQLALGRRFFALLVVPEKSPIIGAALDQATVPGPFWSPCHEVHEFLR